MNYKTLKELCEVISDCPHSTPKWTNHGKIVVRNNNIKNGRIDLSSPSYTDEENFRQRIKRVVPQSGDLIITREAPMGEIGMIPQGVECCLGQRMVLLRANPKICDNYYLLYSIQSREVQHQISWSEGTGTTVSNLRIPHLEQLKIPYIPLKEQKKAVAILKAIDDKISLDNKINDNLEQQAQAIYNSMFVDFDSLNQNETQNSELGLIPTGWNIKLLSEVTQNIRDRVKDNVYNVLSALNTGCLCPSEEYFTKQVFSKNIKNYIVVQEFDFAYNPSRINIGSIGINNLGYTGCVSPVYVVVRPEKGYHHFLDFFIKSKRFKEEVKVRASGSVRQSLTYADFGQIKVVYPPLDVVSDFNNKYEQILQVIQHYKKEIEVLQNIRDMLLPKLMSGEIDVEDVKI